jgi:hypothetical protein
MIVQRLFLNHQHPTEYLLLFSSGIVHAKLHGDFNGQLHDLLKIWFDAKSKRNRNLEDSEWFYFTPSSEICPKEQQKRIAEYYVQRGLFHYTQGNILLARHLHRAEVQPLHKHSVEDDYVKSLVLAYDYLREANEQYPNNLSIQEKYVEILKAVRNARWDPIL